MNLNTTGAQRLHSLDALRGAAALAVVFFHWQHFFYSGTRLAHGFDRQAQPFYAVFKIFYLHGWLAVDLFFSLSGFIFFLLYATKVANRIIEPLHFLVLRFSRLYPLHLLTLLLVAAGQMAYAAINGDGFVYAYHDLRHFVLNLLLLQTIGLERGYSYNGPVWSVSVEVVMYALFFAVCWLRMNRTSVLIVLAVVGFFVVTRYHPLLGTGLGSFFLGGLTYFAFSRINDHSRRNLIARSIVAITAILWGATAVIVYAELDLGKVPLLAQIQADIPTAILFPLTILSLALLDHGKYSFARPLSVLGEISYSSYLLHFPLQLAFVLAARAVGIEASFFYTGAALVAYFAVLLPLSMASFRYLEMPAQRLIRERWLTRRASQSPVAPAELEG